MFVPSFEALCSVLKLDQAEFHGGGTVRIPAALLKLLLQIALTAAEFDEEGYLKANPDVAKAVERGEIESAYMHYIGFGYFEGRQGGGPAVDEKWYLQRYPDVANGIQVSQIASAAQHFYRIGAAEGRSPNAEQEYSAAQWKSAIRP